MNSTPSSEKSVYFDAPTHMSTTPPRPPIDLPAAPTVDAPVVAAPAVVAPVVAKPVVAAPPVESPAAEATVAPKTPLAEIETTVAPTTPPATADPIALTEAERVEAEDVVDPNGVPERKASPTPMIGSPTPNGHSRAASLGYAPSVSRRSVFTNADGRTVAGSTFINGAGTTGPNATAEHNESMHKRAASADAALTEEQKARITKNGG
jgi:hypothetical protein